MYKFTLFCAFFTLVGSYPQQFATKKFKVGIEYDGSLPMKGGSDRYRHRNNYDPFFVTVNTSARSGFVISYIDVSATTDVDGDVEFNVIRGQTGSRSLVFQLVSNQSEFLSYSYLVYGIREEEYKKLANIISIPMKNFSNRLAYNCFSIFVLIILCCKYILS
ncbi:uncharacterized protein LOC126772081 [Nymphalis io]|uniref:uncharacterized protein LOC126772081 n=1 Tax=Inachis io TaxID=171585 RepID=UPI0021688549|nr:uncharacterized protein LOC126772081 [Nymphalis io]